MVEMSPPRVVVRFGDPILVNCSSLANQPEGMGWESTYGGTGLKDFVSYIILNISSAKDWKIEPVCFITYHDGEQCPSNLPVTVYKTPDSVSMALQDKMVEGQKYSVRCDVVNVAPVGNLSVRLYKGNEVFLTKKFSDSTLGPVNKSVVTTIEGRRDDDGAQIRCEAELNFESVEQNPPAVRSISHELTVLYRPVLTENETIEILPGNKLILNCTTKGNPMPTYSWQFPQPAPQMKEHENVDGPILSPSFQLPGPYACTASNRLGKTTKYFMVTEKRDRTTFAALVGGFVALGVLIAIGGLFLLTPNGTFSCTKGYLRGQPV